MTTEDYLRSILRQQELSQHEYDLMSRLREEIERRLSPLDGSPRFYYAGSYGKQTIIRERYDLDIVVYWPTTTQYTIKDIYDGVGTQLKNAWPNVKSKTVAWEVPIYSNLHIDVVPGRALDTAYREANLYRTDTRTTLKTSIKTHIDTVRGSGRRDAIRLLKLWRERKKVPFKKSFLLEIMTIEGSKYKAALPDQAWSALIYIRDNIETVQIKDPANSNNSLSDDISLSDKKRIREIASTTIANESWTYMFSP